jgi:hypothetical protein
MVSFTTSTMDQHQYKIWFHFQFAMLDHSPLWEGAYYHFHITGMFVCFLRGL